MMLIKISGGNMKNPFLVAPALLLALFLAPLLHAQEAPRIELFAGGSAVYLPPGSFYGVQGEAAINFTRHLGVVGDLGTQSRTAAGVPQRFTQGMGGLQLALHHRVSPFVHGLVGAAIAEQGTQTFQDITLPAITRYGLVVAIGGGLDVSLNHLIAVRLAGDWIPSRVNGAWTKDQKRVGLGIVFKLGRGQR
jgi:hypothetical protein